jgi:hypothetical protein
MHARRAMIVVTARNQALTKASYRRDTSIDANFHDHWQEARSVIEAKRSFTFADNCHHEGSLGAQ